MDDFLEARAAHIETGGDVDSTAVSWDSLKGDSDQVFALAMDLLFHPKFSEEKLQLAKQQMATGIVRRNDDEGEIAQREAAKLVYGANGPYTRQPELATIGAVTLADLQAWHDRTLKGKLIVGISGDFDPVAMEAKVRAAFEGLPQVEAVAGAARRVCRTEAGGLLHRQGRCEPVERADCWAGDRQAESRRARACGDERDSWRRVREPIVPEGSDGAGTGVRGRRGLGNAVRPSGLVPGGGAY